MGVTQDSASQTAPPPPPKKKVSRAEYARRRRVTAGRVFKALRDIKAIIETLETEGTL